MGRITTGVGVISVVKTDGSFDLLRMSLIGKYASTSQMQRLMQQHAKSSEMTIATGMVTERFIQDL